MATAWTRLRHGISQTARVGWYAAHYLAVNRMRGPLTRPGEAPFKPEGKLPGFQGMAAEIRKLIARDAGHVARGTYRAADPLLPPGEMLARSRRFFQDVPTLDARRMARGHSDVRETYPHKDKLKAYPRYYLQNFHYQTDGWLSEDSAKIYDTQVEILFAGTADMMRRQALLPIARFMEGRDQREVTLLDLATGTGRFLRDLKATWPRMGVVALDLSEAYLREARANLKPWSRWVTAQGLAEKLPFGDKSLDIVTASYLFHELPSKIRRAVFAEAARVLKPGGLFVVTDALQTGDAENFDGLLEFFPVGFHEPYFTSFLKEDFPALAAENGLEPFGRESAFLTKVLTFQKSA
ncbi:class I SAM-dependent methyltransferase [Tepidicaulis sp. LMO-SS28]|uniref:class I SAM-dependent methyltransferase n=1 Tax=Tepidicaulis sp. LMO-SS28 TaxID=3447455 RepID=UPI003EE0A471